MRGAVWVAMLTGCVGDVVEAPPTADVPVDAADSDLPPDLPPVAPDTDSAAPEPLDTDVAQPPPWDPTLDAVFVRHDGKAYWFRGADYLRYDVARDEADSGYPRATADWWQGVGSAPLDAALDDGGTGAWLLRGSQALRYAWPEDRVVETTSLDALWPGVGDARVDAAFRWDDTVFLFRGDTVWRWRDGAVVAGDPRPVAALWPDAGSGTVDAAFRYDDGGSARVYLHRGAQYWRVDLPAGTVRADYPRPRGPWWPGVWAEAEGTGAPGDRLPSAVAALLFARPDAAEIAARRARMVSAAVADGYTDHTPTYPTFVASLEDRQQAWGCILARRNSDGAWRFRCATDTRGPRRLDIDPLTITHIDWASAAYHRDQVSQGDLLADVGTPLSILASDDGTFRVVSVTANRPTGSIVAGLNIRVAYTWGGVENQIGFSHCNDGVPGYVLDAAAASTPLPVGTVFGFVGTTGNFWIAGPPDADRPALPSDGLPAPHTHVWFVGASDDHERMSVRSRTVLDMTSRYPYGGG